jgi:hypothetical protein
MDYIDDVCSGTLQVVHPLVDEVSMTIGRGSICGEDVLIDILRNGHCMPRRKVTVNVTSECDLLVLSLVDTLQVCFTI